MQMPQKAPKCVKIFKKPKLKYFFITLQYLIIKIIFTSIYTRQYLITILVKNYILLSGFRHSFTQRELLQRCLYMKFETLGGVFTGVENTLLSILCQL